MVAPADAVPAGDGRRLALQGSVPLGGYLRHRSPASIRVRFLFHAVSGGDGVLRGYRSRGGGRLVARRALGRGSLAHVRDLHGRSGALVSANLWREHMDRYGGGGVARDLFVARPDGRARAAGLETALEDIMAKVGFIGLGNMGMPMAENLLKGAYEVTGFDLNAAATERLADKGGSRANSLADACNAAEIVITMLPSGEQVREVYLGAGGVLASIRPGALLIDSSTIDVQTAREVAQAAQNKGFAMVDAPVSGGVAGAEAASLTFMVGGSDEAFDRARPVLEKMGKTIVHAGAPGNGQAAKICNNMILVVSMIVVSEAFLLAEKLGLDAQKFFEVASQSSGRCWSLTDYCPVPGPVPSSPANRDYQAGFTAAMMLKDLKIAHEAARGTKSVSPLAAGATAVYQRFVDEGGSTTDFSGIIRFLRGA